MKKYFLLFIVGLLACAGSREIDFGGDAPGSPMMIWFGDDTDLPLESQINLPPDSSLTWIDKTICGGGAALGSERGEFIIAAPVSDTSKNRSEDKKPKPFFHKVDTSLNSKTIPTFKSDGGFNFFRAPHKILDEHKAQQFDVRVTITLPRMTLQQAAELEARVCKLFPEAQEIDFGLEKKIEAPTKSFYYDMPDGTEFRILPGYFPLPLAPFEKFKPGSILKGDSTGIPVWQEF